MHMKRLRSMVRRLSRSEKGFTLIELLVVIGILAVLAGVATLGVTQFIGKGADEAWNTEKHNVQTAIAGYMVDNAGAVPAALGDLEDYLLTDTQWDDWVWDPVTGKITNESRASEPDETEE